MAFTPKLLQQGSAGRGPKNYIEDVFSTHLYTGNGSTQTITNGIDLSTKGGLVWIKSRSNVEFHRIFDTARGVNQSLSSNSTNAQNAAVNTVTAFNTTGFNLGNDSDGNGTNTSAYTYASWTFRKQPKFFDVVTYTGTGSNTTIAHSLGSVPGSIIVKRTDTTADWAVYHRSLANTQYLVLNTTAVPATGATWWNSTTPTSSVFSVGTDASVNASGGTYVAYIFAHDAGGFGLTGTDNVISCGSFVSNAGNSYTPVIDLGWEPQWIFTRGTSGSDNWKICDTMRGLTLGPTYANALKPNTTDSEDVPGNYIWLNSESGTSFGFQGGPGQLNGTFIYIAIRKGPMKVPTSGTSVFAPAYGLNAGANGQAWNAGFPVDMYIRDNPAASDFYTSDRLRRSVNYLLTNSTAAESNVAYSDKLDNNIGVFSTNAYDYRTWIGWQFRRAPSFFDEVCYTGNGNAGGQTITHNLTVTPELIIVKRRDSVEQWRVYTASQGVSAYAALNSTAAFATDANNPWKTPTSTTFGVGDGTYWTSLNASGGTYVAYLFATCAGVSKVGSYTGTATTLQIDCGFTGGARFVLIKRTDSTGAWYVWDTARGIVSGNDPYLLLNSTAAEVTNTDYIDTYSAGFEISSTAPAAINNSGGTYIFLAIA